MEIPGHVGVRIMVLNATFNNSSVISWRSVLLVDEGSFSTPRHKQNSTNVNHNFSGDRH